MANGTLIGSAARDPEAAGVAEAPRRTESDAMSCGGVKSLGPRGAAAEWRRRRRGRRKDGGVRDWSRAAGASGLRRVVLCCAVQALLSLLRVSVSWAELFMALFTSAFHLFFPPHFVCSLFCIRSRGVFYGVPRYHHKQTSTACT